MGCTKALRSRILNRAACVECVFYVKCCAAKTYAGNLKRRDHLGEQRVDGKNTQLVLNRMCDAFASFNQAQWSSNAQYLNAYVWKLAKSEFLRNPFKVKVCCWGEK